MASCESGDEDVVKLLTCRYCIQLYDEKNHYPRILRCMHTLCEQCVRRLLKDGNIVCPFCRCTWQRPCQGFPGNTVVTSYLTNYKMMTGGYLPRKPRVECGNCSNIAVGFCQDWCMDVCRSCIDSHKLRNISRLNVIRQDCDNCSNTSVGYSQDWGMNVCQQCIDKHKLLNVCKMQGRKTKRAKCPVKNLSSRMCQYHPTILVSVFCVSCQVIGCKDCLESAHRNHHCIDLKSAADQSKRRLQTLTQQFLTDGNSIQGLLSDIDDHIKYIEDVSLQKEKEIDHEFENLVKKLEEQRRDAKMTFRQLCDNKKKVLCHQRREVEGVCAEFRSVAEFTEQMCKFSSPEKVLELREQVCLNFKTAILLNRMAITAQSKLHNELFRCPLQ